MAMPSRYRDQLMSLCGGRLVATIHTDLSCLLLYPVQEWEEIQRKIEALPSFDKVATRVQHLLIGHATDLELDGSGRILVPQSLRSFAKLEKHVPLIGQGRKFEIWSEDTWNEQRDAWLKDSSSEEQMPEELRSLSL